MTSLSDHQSASFTKLLYIGDSSSGKTGSLESLVADGYHLRILDMDNGLDSLKSYIKHKAQDETEAKGRLALVDFETVRDKYKATNAGVIVPAPKAFVKAAALMTKWSDESDPSKWGAETIFVLDSLTAMGNAAYEWAKGLNPTAKDPRQWYGMAQEALENIMALLTSEDFQCNVIVISHVKLVTLPDGTVKGQPTSLGTAQGPILPRYFNTLILAESASTGKNVKRTIKTVPTSTIDLKNPAPFTVLGELPLETGMSTLFKQLKAS